MKQVSYRQKWPSSKQLRRSVYLILLLSGIGISLAGCGEERFVAVPTKLPELPPQIERCLEGRINVPRGDWTVSMVSDVISKYQRREDKLEGCMRDVIALYNSLRSGLARKGRFS